VPYYDSNVFELPGMERTSYGVKFTGRVHQTYRTKQFGVFGELTTQGFLDGQFADESKLIFAPELYSHLQLGSRWFLDGSIQHFQKDYKRIGPTYSRTKLRFEVENQPTNRLRLTGFADRRYYRVNRSQLLHFREDRFGVSTRYLLGQSISLNASTNYLYLYSKDYPAFGHAADSALTVLEQKQSDHGYEISLQAEYTGKIIAGVEAVYERRKSNSIVGKFHDVQISGYLSGRITSRTFYHVIVQVIKKVYAYPNLGGVTGYRDPEQPTHNRLYGRIEQQLSDHISAFGQVSYLKNETLVNRVYFTKTILEFGAKFSF